MKKQEFKKMNKEEVVLAYFKTRLEIAREAEKNALKAFLKDSKEEDKKLSAHDREFYCTAA